jgi:hypothetical protein
VTGSTTQNDKAAFQPPFSLEGHDMADVTMTAKVVFYSKASGTVQPGQSEGRAGTAQQGRAGTAQQD